MDRLKENVGAHLRKWRAADFSQATLESHLCECHFTNLSTATMMWAETEQGLLG